MRIPRRRFLPKPVLMPNLVFLLFLAFGTDDARAGSEAVLQVDRTDDDASFNACVDAVALDCSLRGAISLANTFKVPALIELPAGIFELTINGASEDLNATGDLDISRNMTIRGQGPTVTVISGGDVATLDDRLIEVRSPNLSVAFEALAIVGGAPPSGQHSVFVGSTSSAEFTDCVLSDHGDLVSGGGAVRLAFGAVQATFESCTFSGNRASDVGAAISSGAESLVLRSSSFIDNVSLDFGGALYLEGTGLGPSTISMTGSLFQENQSRRGGAVWAGEDTALTVFSSTFRDNLADTLLLSASEGLFNNSAGAIYTASDLTIEASTFSGNQAELDAAAIVAETLSVTQRQLDVFNTTFSGNAGIGSSLPAIRIVESLAEFLHVTFAGNDLDLSTDQVDLTLQNSVFDTGCGFTLGTVNSNGGNAYPNVSCAADLDPTDLFAPDLGLGPLAPSGGPTWTHVPNPGSPLLGASPICPDFDQRGFPRPATDCDSGSVERQPNEAPIFADGFESGDIGAWSSFVN